jgi:hypothetical protein
MKLNPLYFLVPIVLALSSKASTSSPTGQCGLLLNGNFDGFEAAQNNQSGQITNMLMLINFDTNTLYISSALLANFGATNVTATQSNSTGAFTITSDYIPGSYKLSLTGTNAFMTLLPVNGSSTYLVQLPGNGTSMAPKAGVCQKI